MRPPLIFDLDGVLADTIPLHQQALMLACAAYSSKIDLSGGEPTIEKLRRNGIPEKEIPRIYRLKREHYAELVRRNIRPNLELKSLLANCENHVAVCTNSHLDSAKEVLMALQFLPPVIISTSHGLRPKPEPDLYRAAFQAVRAPCSGCVVFEDSDEGILAAERAGARNIVRCTFNNITTEIQKWL